MCIQLLYKYTNLRVSVYLSVCVWVYAIRKDRGVTWEDGSGSSGGHTCLPNSTRGRFERCSVFPFALSELNSMRVDMTSYHLDCCGRCTGL